ncbi:purine-nucleoside phosphorylase [Fusibacter ferrireducens]|uniref:Purine nucleoside phosphorylase n=1 Tax=Fusibacter ferrireducens TaxID=2785058 RepID=A0ABR9ZT70_9FIRM|nr:purine-nucleoside phosphorylase [Fusibacter ferrireducens]MBF4693670.1 purine-nucleoside phosphorylase [Fusibacter ferrireducens]
MDSLLIKINEAQHYIESKLSEKPKIGLVLGSGLGILADAIESPVYIQYDEIPHFPISTVQGHAGRFVVGNLCGKTVIAMQGRFHYYEGYSMQAITFPVRVMKAIGVEHLILTNAAGGVNKSFKAGDLMLITDHINLTGASPLIGKNEDELGPRFPDASNIYDKTFNKRVLEEASRLGIDLKEGVYFYNTGPAYETPAEVKLAGILGGDAVGMSTAPEALVAAHASLKVTGISCITNMAAGIQVTALNHKEVVETANLVKKTFIELVKKIVEIA